MSKKIIINNAQDISNYISKDVYNYIVLDFLNGNRDFWSGNSIHSGMNSECQIPTQRKRLINMPSTPKNR